MTMHDLQKRFWIVAYHHYYPGGFLNDVRYTADTIEEAKSLVLKIDEPYKYIFDANIREFVYGEEESLDFAEQELFPREDKK